MIAYLIKGFVLAAVALYVMHQSIDTEYLIKIGIASAVTLAIFDTVFKKYMVGGEQENICRTAECQRCADQCFPFA